MTLRAELLELRLSGELFQFELRELQFTLLFQLPPNLLRWDIYRYTLSLMEKLLKSARCWLRDPARRIAGTEIERRSIPIRTTRTASHTVSPTTTQEAAIWCLILLAANAAVVAVVGVSPRSRSHYAALIPRPLPHHAAGIFDAFVGNHAAACRVGMAGRCAGVSGACDVGALVGTKRERKELKLHWSTHTLSGKPLFELITVESGAGCAIGNGAVVNRY